MFINWNKKCTTSGEWKPRLHLKINFLTLNSPPNEDSEILSYIQWLEQKGQFDKGKTQISLQNQFCQSPIAYCCLEIQCQCMFISWNRKCTRFEKLETQISLQNQFCSPSIASLSLEMQCWDMFIR